MPCSRILVDARPASCDNSKSERAQTCALASEVYVAVVLLLTVILIGCSSVSSTKLQAAPADFTLSASPSTQTVMQGSVTEYTVAIAAVGGFSGVVTLSATGLPTGVTATFGPGTVSGSGASSINVTTATTTATGTFNVMITGASGTLTHSTIIALVVNSANSSSPTPGGGLVALGPNQSAGNNLVPNSGFESGSSGWSLGSCFALDSSTAHSGTNSMKFRAGGGCPQSATTTTQVTGNWGSPGAYTLQGWIKGSSGTDIQANLTIHDVTDGGDIVAETDLVVPASTWQLVQRQNIDVLPLHNGHTFSIELSVSSGTNGTVWFDDVQLVQQLPPSISAFLLYPNYKGYLWTTGPQTVRLQIEVPNPQGMQVIESLQAEGGSVIHTTQQPAQTGQEIDFDGSSIAQGSYLIHTSLADANGNTIATYPDYRVLKVDATFQAGLVNYIGPDQFLIHKGQKHFVWGVYDRLSSLRCGTISCLSTNEQNYLNIPGFDNLTTIGSYQATMLNSEMNILPFAGVNVEPGDDQLTPWLQALDSIGASHLQIVNNWVQGSPGRPSWASNLTDAQLWQMLAGAMNGKPGELGYYIYDEPDSTTIPAVFPQYRAFLAQDSGGIDFGTLAHFTSMYRWRDTVDVASADPYPVGNVPMYNEYALGARTAPVMMRTSLWTQQVVNQVYGARPVWMVLQLWVQNGQFPTYTQMKQQAYKAIINGANGILWWGFVSSLGIEYEWYTLNNQQPYFDFQRISQEVMGLEPVLTSAAQPSLLQSVSSPQIEYLVKVNPNTNQLVIFASNLLETPAGNVTFSLSSAVGSTSATATVYSEGRTVPLTGATFTDSFASYDVHVYTIDR